MYCHSLSLQEKAIVIRLSRIIFAFRNGVWPKPMEGLDLFNPVLAACQDGSDSSSEEVSSSGSDVESDMDSGHDSDAGSMERKERGGLHAGETWRSERVSTETGTRGNTGSLIVRISPKVSSEASSAGTELGASFQVEKVHIYCPTMCVGRLLNVDHMDARGRLFSLPSV